MFVTATPPASLGEAGGAADPAGPEAPGASTTGSEVVGEPPPPSAAPAELESEAPDTGVSETPETPEAPETEAPEGSGTSGSSAG